MESNQSLQERTDWEVQMLRAAYSEMLPVSGLERDFMMRIKRQADLFEELGKELAAYQESSFNPDWSMLQATRDSLREHAAEIRRLQGLLRDIRNAALPDPYDERDISLEWLRKLIQEKTNELVR